MIFSGPEAAELVTLPLCLVNVVSLGSEKPAVERATFNGFKAL
jgi:hypothetical protein